ncbi:aminotransferase family protein [Niallia nealsonii]
MIMNANHYSELVELDKKHFVHPTSSIKQQQEFGPAYIFTEAKGVMVKDIEGKEYIEGMSSLWNVNIGYGREELGEAAMEQIKTMSFSNAFYTFSHEPGIRLAEKLASISPGDLNHIFFTSGGSESNDTAFKLARHYWILKGEPNRKKIIARKQAYHGVATGSTSATGIKQFHTMTNSLAPDFVHTEALSVDALRDTIEAEGPSTIAAFIAEPVMGAGGLFYPPEDYFAGIRNVCDEYGILFITDEVITGFGRTGSLFCMDHYGVVPDMMTFAKGVTSGYFPLGGVMMSEKVFSVLKDKSDGPLFHGFTYSGHPVGCAVALKNLEIIEKEQLVQNAKERGEELLAGFKQIEEEFEHIADIRGKGLLAAFDLFMDRDQKTRFPEKMAPKIMDEAMKRGLICRNITYGESDTVVFSPPLVISSEEISRLLMILRESIQVVLNKIVVG